jgi:single-strand DNA-binding protein
MSMNKILVIGNVGNDPEMRYTPSGAAVTTFSLATNRVYTTSDGERREETEWFRVSAWGRLAEQCNNYVTKGRKVYAEGRLKSDTWTGNDGQPRVSLEINADRVIFLDRAGDVAGGATQGPAGADAPPGSGSTEDVDDLPW